MIEPEHTTKMLSCHYNKHSLSSITVGTVPMVREPKINEIIVKIHSTSLNPADWKSASGEQAALLSFDWPRVIGFDFSGTVHQLGNQQSDTFKVGDRVFGMIQGLPERDRGTLQEYCVVKEKICARIPTNTSYKSAAAVPLVGITAVKMLEACGLTSLDLTVANAADGEEKKQSEPELRVLVTGGAGGVGVHAIQIAKNLFGATFVATTASAGTKTELCRQVGADLIVDYKASKFEEVLSGDEKKFDAILDCTGEASKCIKLLKRGGGMCSILAGPTADALQTWLREGEWPTSKVTIGVHSFLHSGCGGSLFQFFAGGSSLVSKCVKEGATFAHVIGTGNGKIMKILGEMMKMKLLVAIVDKEYALDDAVEAIHYQKAGRCAGKVVVNVVPEE